MAVTNGTNTNVWPRRCGIISYYPMVSLLVPTIRLDTLAFPSIMACRDLLTMIVKMYRREATAPGH